MPYGDCASRSFTMLGLMTLLLWTPASPLLAEGQKVAFVVGVERYIPEFFRKLDYAEDDAVALSQRLEGMGYHVIRMTSQEENPERSPATPEDILRVLDGRLKGLAEDDTLLVALTGHGVQFADDPLLPIGARETYFCPSRARLDDRRTLLPINQQVLSRVHRCPAGRKLVLIDACRNEVLSKSGSKSSEAIKLQPVHENPRTIPRGMTVLYSCSSKEKSWEHGDLKHSVFMNYVLEYLDGKAGRDFYLRQMPSLTGLKEYVRTRTHQFVLDRITASGQLPEAKGDDAPWILGPLPMARTITNSLGMRLVLISPGTFQMGIRLTPAEVARRFESRAAYFEDEHPLHRVNLTEPFYLGAHEVTVGQFRQFIRAEGYRTEAERDGEGGIGWDDQLKEFRQDPKYTWQTPGFSQSDSHPVVNVSWNDAVAFCKWLGGKEGAAYRLPTEAQWEFACRAGSRTLYSCGDDPEQLAQASNVGDGTLRQQMVDWKFETIKARDGFVFTAPVGSFRANDWGLHDMHGNVLEWCSDWYGEQYYAASPSSDPQGPLTGSLRVYRGGGWSISPQFCRSAYRYRYSPVHRFNFLGFRVARSSISR